MKIVAHPSQNPEIEILELSGNLFERAALETKQYFYNCVDNNKYFILINFKNVNVVDNDIIHVIGDFANHDLLIRLFNVGEEVRWMIRGSGRFDVLRKIYDHADNIKAISLFEEEVLKKQKTLKDTIYKQKIKKGTINKRRYPRSLNVKVPAEFDYNPGQNNMILGKVNVLNISEGGALLGDVQIVNKLTGRVFEIKRIEGQKLYGLRFKLDESKQIINTTARCVRSYKIDDILYSGVVFLDINGKNRELIREFVSSYFDLGRL